MYAPVTISVIDGHCVAAVVGKAKRFGGIRHGVGEIAVAVYGRPAGIHDIPRRLRAEISQKRR